MGAAGGDHLKAENGHALPKSPSGIAMSEMNGLTNGDSKMGCFQNVSPSGEKGGGSEGVQPPLIRWASAEAYLKMQDRLIAEPELHPPSWCKRLRGHSISMFAVMDGHNGSACAQFVKEHLATYLWEFLEAEMTRKHCKEVSACVPDAINGAFVQLHRDFSSQGTY